MKSSESNELKWAFGVGAGFAMVLVLSLDLSWGRELLWGWYAYATKVFPNVQIRWDGVAVFLIGFAIATTCFHHLVRWWIQERTKSALDNSRASTDEHLIRWRLRSSIAIVLIFLSVFVVGISMAGVVHQAAWLLKSPTGFTVQKTQTTEDVEMSIYDPLHTPVGTSWLTEIRHFLPFMLENDLTANSPFNDRPFNDPVCAKNFKGVLPQAICPSQGNPLFSQDGFGLSQVVANPGALGGKLTDKNSSGIMLGEINAGFAPWGSPHNVRNPALGLRKDWRGTSKGKVGLGSVHSAGVNFCFIDCSIQFLDEEIDPEVLRQLANAMKVEP